MTTIASAAATSIAEGLAGEGFDVRPVLVQRWREERLLGGWDHVHAGPGSTAVAPVGAYERARLLARLKPSDRTIVNVALLGLVGGIPNIAAVELADAITMFIAPAKTTVAGAQGDDSRDRAEAAVAQMRDSRRRQAEITALSHRLAGAPEPFNSHEDEGEPAATAVERTEAVLAATLAAVDGDTSWVGTVAADSLHLSGLGAAAKAAELDNLAVAAEFAFALEIPVAELFQAVDAVGQLTPADIDTVRAVLGLLATIGGDDLTVFATAATPIVEPHQLTRWTAVMILDQVAHPKRFRDVLEQHRAEALADEAALAVVVEQTGDST